MEGIEIFALFRWFPCEWNKSAQIFNTQTKIYPVLCEHVYNLTIAQLQKDFHKNFTQAKRKSGSGSPLTLPGVSISTDGRQNAWATLLIEVSYHKI